MKAAEYGPAVSPGFNRDSSCIFGVFIFFRIACNRSIFKFLEFHIGYCMYVYHYSSMSEL